MELYERGGLVIPAGAIIATSINYPQQQVLKDKLVEGYKADEDKVRFDLIPPEALFALASVLTFGSIKYEDRNWEKGMKWGRPFGALMRHMWAWWRGEQADPETGYSHLWHAFCCVAFLITYEQRKIGTDDRG